VSLLEKMAAEPCESFTGPMFGGTMTCMSEGSGRTPDAPYLADRYCPPCRLRAALDELTTPAAETISTEAHSRYYPKGLDGERISGRSPYAQIFIEGAQYGLTLPRDEEPAEEYKGAYEIWKAWGQRANEALQQIWKMAVPYDTAHMTFGDDPETVTKAVQEAIAGTEYAVRILWSAEGVPDIRPMGSRAEAFAFRSPRAPWSLDIVRRTVGAWQEDSERPTDEEFWEIAKIRYGQVSRQSRGAHPWDRLTEGAKNREFRIAVSAWEYAHEVPTWDEIEKDAHAEEEQA
jgi:hypothetical protein